MTDRMDISKIPTRRLYTGKAIPCMGLGTLGSDKYGPEQIAEAVYGAVRFACRLIDCAAVYQNDRGCRLVKGQVFLWEGTDGREDLWDMDGTDASWKKEIWQ